MKGVWGRFLPVVALVAGLGLGVLCENRENLSDLDMQCRPSSPELLASGPKVLFWGNSLAFDHGWAVDGYLTVNCARQGLTAKQAVTMIEALPDIDAAAIVLVFGTVELARDIESVSEFQAAIESILTRLEVDHPGARIVMLGIPDGGSDVWTYQGNRALPGMNAFLAGIDGAAFLDTMGALSVLPDSDRSYDGVHLSGDAYNVLEQALQELLGEDSSEVRKELFRVKHSPFYL